MKKFFLFLVALLSIVACSKSDSGSSGNNGSNDGTYTLTHFLKMTTQKNSK